MTLRVWTVILVCCFIAYAKIGSESFVGCVQSGDSPLDCAFDKTVL
jgi:hypothetical protein